MHTAHQTIRNILFRQMSPYKLPMLIIKESAACKLLPNNVVGRGAVLQKSIRTIRSPTSENF
jgi:hypothetical protein